MSGWPLSLLLGLVALAGIAMAARPQRGALLLLGAALLVGLAGYVWQGSPALSGQPAIERPHRRGGDTLFADERKVWLETVGPDALQLDGADAMIRNGDTDYAVGLLHAYLVHAPANMMLWLGLGNALQAHADGMLTPAARYAFARAAAVAPDHPAPPYFLGLAYLQMGDADDAEAIWRALLAKAPAGAAWRAKLAGRIMLVDRMRALH